MDRYKLGFNVLLAGLVCLPFYEILVRALPLAYVSTPDARLAKSLFGLIFALAVGLSVCFSEGFKPCKNVWIILLILFIPFNIHLSPKFHFIINEQDAWNFWVWKPFAESLCYFLMFMAVQSMEIDFDRIIRVIFWCGFVTAIYCTLQFIGLDQFYDVQRILIINSLNNGLEDIMKQVTRGNIGGNLGHPTLVAPFIALAMPFAIHLRKYIPALFMIATVIFIKSDMATGALIVSLTAYCILKFGKKAVISVILIFICVGIFLFFHKGLVTSLANDNGRFNVWNGAIKVMANNRIGEGGDSIFPFTGHGIGSWPFVMRKILNTRFAQAHNEYLEVYCTMGIIGLSFFVMALWFTFKQVLSSSPVNYDEKICLSSSLLCLCLIAFGTFIFQVNPQNFYTVTLLGCLHNQKLLEG